jgi:uncharacterized protein (TIGR00375 family)
MKFVADFHIHSKYSRATSPSTDLENLDKWAKIKGVNVLGTGDFTHPLWFKELKQKLRPAEPGLFVLKTHPSRLPKEGELLRFLLSCEISCIYKKNNKVRKVHIIVLAPSFEVVEKINEELSKIGNLKSDGRPILGLDAKDLLKIILNISKDCLAIPAHIWTPWFSIFGSKSGFNSLEECFEELTPYIYAVETGLCSSPTMNWQIPELDNITLLSNSDAHSPQKIGREANVFDTEFSYKGIIDAIKNHTLPKKIGQAKLLYTIEFFPEEGKYYNDGHRNCKVNFSPKESKKNNALCPVCKKPLVIGVLSRIEELAKRKFGSKPKSAAPFKTIIPLKEIITDIQKKSVISKDVEKIYNNLILKLGNEFNILLNATEKNITKHSSLKIANGILRARQGRVKIKPGYDGVYGKIKIS